MQGPKSKLRLRRMRPLKSSKEYKILWYITDGAVRDTFKMHPDYVSKKSAADCRRSINKRVTGALLGELQRLRREARGG